MWSGLVSDKAPVNQAEIGALNKLLKTYEAENFRQKNELETADVANKAHLAHLAENEKGRQKLVKQIKSMESSMKYEKMASEGLAKKAGVLEFELNNIKEERKTLLEEQVFNRKRVKELESSLNDDRCKRLQEIHLNEILQLRNQELEVGASINDKDLVNTRKDFLDKLQRMETLTTQCEAQQRIIQMQSDEAVLMSREVGHIRESLRQLTETVLSQEQALADKAHDCALLEQEVWRLRKELLTVATSHTERSQAYQVRGSTAVRDTRMLTSSSAALRPPRINTALPQSEGGRSGISPLMSPVNFSYTCTPQPQSSQTATALQHCMSDDEDMYRSLSVGTGFAPDRPQLQSRTMTHSSLSAATAATSLQSQSQSYMTSTTVTVTDDASTQSCFMVSPKSAPMRPHTNHRHNNTHQLAKIQTLGDQEQGRHAATAPQPGRRQQADRETDMQLSQSRLATTSNSTHMHNRHNNNNSKSTPSTAAAGAGAGGGTGYEPRPASSQLSSLIRTRYVGCGLGLRQDTEEALPSRGSAKAVLKKIMQDFQNNS